MHTYYTRLKNGLLGLTYLAMAFNIASARIFDDAGIIRPEAIELFRIYRPMIEANHVLPSKTLDTLLQTNLDTKNVPIRDLNKIGQAIFLRPYTLERTELDVFTQQFLKYNTDRVLDLFKQLDVWSPIAPNQKHYDHILIHGNFLPILRAEIAFLAECVEQGTIVIEPDTHIAILTGERDLTADEIESLTTRDSSWNLDPAWICPTTKPTTEDRAVEWIWAQTLLPKALRAAHVTITHTPKTQQIDPITQKTYVKRPTTETATESWLDICHPKPGSCLSLSIQPFVEFQKMVVTYCLKDRHLFNAGFTIEGVGPILPPEFLENYKASSIGILLDNLARTLYVQV